MVNHLTKGVPNLAETRQLLRELQVKNRLWTWRTEKQQRTFNKTKELLTLSLILTLFNPNDETVVSAEAYLPLALVQFWYKKSEWTVHIHVHLNITSTTINRTEICTNRKGGAAFYLGVQINVSRTT